MAKILAKMEAELPLAAAFLPNYLRISALAYCFTLDTTLIGEDRIREIKQNKHTGISNTDHLSAAKVAPKALGVNSLGLITS